MSSRYGQDQDRYRRADYGRYEESDYERSPRGRSQNRDDDEFSSSRLRRFDQRQPDYSSEREFRRDYGRGYAPQYGSSYGSSYSGRYRDEDREDDYERGYRGREQQYRHSFSSRGSNPRFGGSYTSNVNSERGSYGRSEIGSRRSQFDLTTRQPERSHERGWWDRITDELASWFGDEDAERRRRMDEAYAAGTHRGKGPRGYTRSDERIREDVNDRLTDYDYLDASDIEVSVDQCVVKLDGSVDSRWAKHIAEDIAETVSGVIDVENNLRVNRFPETARTGISAGSTATDTPGTSKVRAKGAS